MMYFSPTVAAMAAAVLLTALAHTPYAQVPTFGSPHLEQRVLLTDPATGTRRSITLTKRPDGDYDLSSVDVKSGAVASGQLRGDGQKRFSGDIFDAASGSFREVVVIEQGDSLFELQRYDYVTGRRDRGLVRCQERQCRYEVLPAP